MPGIKRISVGLVRRNAVKRGPTSSDQWNDSWAEAQNDLTSISQQWNDKLIPLFSTIADGSQEIGLDAFVNGLDGRTVFTDSSASITDSDLTYFNSNKSRPRTVKEQFVNVYGTITSTRTELLNEIEAVRAESGTGSSGAFLRTDGTNTMSGTLKAAAGDSGSPGYTFATDLDTGLFRPGENEIAISTAGSEIVRFNGTGSTFSSKVSISSGNLNIASGDLQIGGVNTIDSTRKATLTDLETQAFKLTTGASNGFVLTSDASGIGTWQASTAGVTDHGALTGLSDDDHTQYALLAGRSGGQTLEGGTAAGEDLTLSSTMSVTKGSILFGSSAYDEANNRLGIKTAAPTAELDVDGDVDISGNLDLESGDLQLNGTTRLNNSGGAILTSFQLPPGATDGFVLTADGSGNGTWEPAPTAGATAKLRSIQTVSDDYTIDETSDGTVLVDAASAGVNVTLPTSTAASGLCFTVKKIDSSSNLVTVSGQSGETIDGLTTQETDVQWDFMQLQADGSDWYIVG